MASMQQKAQCVLWYHEFKSPLTVQRHYRTKYGQTPLCQPSIVFQQDGAPPHWGINVRRFLDTMFPERWIGRDGPTLWPARSPDITPLDFFLWDFVKDNVYRTPVPDMVTLKTRICSAIECITEEMLENT